MNKLQLLNGLVVRVQDGLPLLQQPFRQSTAVKVYERLEAAWPWALALCRNSQVLAPAKSIPLVIRLLPMVNKYTQWLLQGKPVVAATHASSSITNSTPTASSSSSCTTTNTNSSGSSSTASGNGSRTTGAYDTCSSMGVKMIQVNNSLAPAHEAGLSLAMMLITAVMSNIGEPGQQAWAGARPHMVATGTGGLLHNRMMHRALQLSWHCCCETLSTCVITQRAAHVTSTFQINEHV
jgi:hypothetical protein